MFHASPKFLAKLEAERKSSSTLPPDPRAFLDAAKNGDADKVRALLAKGVPVDVREDFCLHYVQNEQTALMYAAGDGRLEVVRLLLEAGASVSAVDKNMSREDDGAQTALHYAVQQKNVAVIEELLSAGADVNALSFSRNTPLNKAIWHDNIEGARLLVQRGTNLGSKIGRKQARSPLYVSVDAVRNKVPVETVRDFVLFLLEAGADPNGIGDANATTIFRLAWAEDIPAEIVTQLLEKLLKAGAKPDWLDKFGDPPLLGAALYEKPAPVKLLLEAGAEVNRIFKRGTALDINEHDLAECKKDLKEFSTANPPADEKGAERHKKYGGLLEDKLQRCKAVSEILHKFGAKRKSELPQA